MKVRAVILAGGEGTRLSVLTSKRAKPAVLFAGKYRIIDFTLSNCVNSLISDVMVLAQYRPQSLIEHIGSGGPWDLNLDFTGGVRILTPYKAKASDWFIGTADAVQQNFAFIKRGNPDHIMILSGDHIYAMDYQKMIDAHIRSNADATIACITVPIEEASRFGILKYDHNSQIYNFEEKPKTPTSNTANMGIYLFKCEILNQVLWDDRSCPDSKHDFGSDIIPGLLHKSYNVCAYHFDGYWVDVGTIESYWQAHMDLLSDTPPFSLYNPNWVIHTRSYERPPVIIQKGAKIENSLISDGCIIESDALVKNCILSPGVHVHKNAIIKESIFFTDCEIHENAKIFRCVADKRVNFGINSKVGLSRDPSAKITLIGKDSLVMDEMTICPGGIVGTDVIESDYQSKTVKSGEIIQTRRLPYEI
jgi:glucose-1-phosphate adenylyltransferase